MMMIDDIIKFIFGGYFHTNTQILYFLINNDNETILTNEQSTNEPTKSSFFQQKIGRSRSERTKLP